MFKHIALAACSVLFAANLMAAQPAAKPTHVVLDTSFGKIELELEDQKAPISTKNFLSYVDSGFYTNTIFHRVIPGFMVQGGGFTAQMLQKQTKDPIKNEAANGLHNVRGTIAMARTSDVNSATSQFFINTNDNQRRHAKRANRPDPDQVGKTRRLMAGIGPGETCMSKAGFTRSDQGSFQSVRRARFIGGRQSQCFIVVLKN